ncbi:MAG: hypothetical protein QOJ19_5077 [Acidimicrobiia bacterium]|jgi:hypothetical protein|nr:hypothetical protein [Acidimicrobiia bacterium]
MTDDLDLPALKAVAALYHRYLTGLLLGLVQRHGPQRAAEVCFRTFRRQHLEKFLPGLEKLGLTNLPPAVACAQYHYLSNALGGVAVEWIPESDRKSWVRYRPPRWIFDGTAVCGIPTEVSRAMLWGWHAHNGVSLGNPRLGFVCTSLVTDAGAGLVGYYIEEDRELQPDERLRFAPAESPPGPAGDLPSVDWQPDRLAKVERNYAMEYVRSILPELCAVLGPADAGHVGRTAGRQVAMQYHDELCGPLSSDGGRGAAPAERSPESFARLLARLSKAQSDRVTVEVAASGHEAFVRQTSWNVVGGTLLPPEGFEAWAGLWEGLAAVHADPPGLRLDVLERLDLGDPYFEWRIRRRRR